VEIIKVVEIAFLKWGNELFRFGFMFVSHLYSYGDRNLRPVKCACFI